MIPHTILEKHIVAQSATLPAITPEMLSWAEQNIFLKWGVLSRGKFHCLDCGHAWKPQCGKNEPKFTKCTACQGKLKIHGCNQVHFKEIEYSAVVTSTSEFQIVRILCSHKMMKKNCLPTYFHTEVMQHWIDCKGEVRTFSLSTNPFSGAYDAWQYHTALEIRPKDFQDSPKYRINPYRVYPRFTLLKQIKRNGFKTTFYDIAPQVLLSSLLKDHCTETFLKSGQASWLRYYLGSSNQHINRNWQAVKICLKNNYAVPDFGIWEDYLQLLRYFKKDLCSSCYVCPENLYEAHNRLVAKKRTIQRRENLLKMRAEIASAQEIYQQDKKDFFGLCFTEKDLTISVIENVQDFMEEGDNLHHCVFTNQYYKKKNSLILSAKVDNRNIETIELSLVNMKVIQCRGIRNNFSKHHKQILSLMTKNLYQIKARMKKKKISI